MSQNCNKFKSINKTEYLPQVSNLGSKSRFRIFFASFIILINVILLPIDRVSWLNTEERKEVHKTKT